MPSITITIDDDAKRVLDKRAKKNFMSLREQIEDIVRRSAVNYKSGKSSGIDVDDRLVGIFSRKKRKKKS